MASTGLRIANITGTNTVTLSAGYTAAETQTTGYGVFEPGDPPCNINPVTVTYAADGTTAIPPTKGSFCTDAETSIYLYVPFNADGTTRLEITTLSALWITGAQVNYSGDTTYVFPTAPFFDPGDPYTFYTLSSLSRIYKGVYNPSHSAACARFKSYSFGSMNGFAPYLSQNQDCVDWTNLTSPAASPSKLPGDQMIAAYATGLNQLGQQVGIAHPTMGDIGWMGSFVSFQKVVGNLICATLRVSQNFLGAVGCFDLTTGVLKSLTDSFSTWPVMASGIHAAGSWNAPGLTWNQMVTWPMYPGGATTIPFIRPFEAAVSQINTAGFGSIPSWVAASEINGTGVLTSANVYTCPTFTDPKVTGDFSTWSGANECVQVRITTPLCNHNPAPNAGGGGYSFAGGQSESQAFPCSTPGFGVPGGASGYSKFWDIFAGMWLWDITSYDYAEDFVVATAPVYNASNSIDVWLIRFAKNKAIVPKIGATPLQDDCREVLGTFETNHTNPWSLAGWPPYSD